MSFKNSILNYLELLKISFYLFFIKLKEYKLTFYFGFIIEVIYTCSIVFFYVIFFKKVMLFNWKFKDFILFFIFFSLINSFAGIFAWREPITYKLKRGELNLLLTKPKNIYFLYLFLNLTNGITSTVILLFLFIVLMIVFDFILYNIFLGIFFIIFLCFYTILFEILLKSLGLIKYHLEDFFLCVNSNLTSKVEYYTPLVFKRATFRLLVNIVPTYFVGTILIPIFNNQITKAVFYQIIFLFIMFIIIVVLTFIVWRYGLKKYTAYN